MITIKLGYISQSTSKAESLYLTTTLTILKAVNDFGLLILLHPQHFYMQLTPAVKADYDAKYLYYYIQNNISCKGVARNRFVELSILLVYLLNRIDLFLEIFSYRG